MEIAIIGGGITGLTAAYRLSKNGHRVTVFEKENTLGGLAGGFKQFHWDWSLEKTYHHFFTNDTAMLSLLHELNLDEKIIIKRPITATFFKLSSLSGGVRWGSPIERPQSRSCKNKTSNNNKTEGIRSIDYMNDATVNGMKTSNGEKRTTGPGDCPIFQLDSTLSLLQFPLLPIVDKLRTALLIAFCKLNPFWKPLESITAKDFFTTYGGQRSWSMIWEPLMAGKFGRYADHVPASWLWARLHKRTMQLGYLEGGFATLIDGLERAIKRNGGRIYTNSPIISINVQSTNDKPTNLQINSSNDKNLTFVICHLSFNNVIITVPSVTALKLVKFPQPYANQLKSIPHLWSQTLILETHKPILDHTYWLNINDRSFPFLAVVQHTNMIDKKHYGGRHIAYIGNYLPDRHPYLSMTKQQLLQQFLPYIKILNSQFNSEFSILNSELFSLPYSQPIHSLHYSHKAPPLTSPIPGIYLANLDSIYPWDRGTNYAVELGENAARNIFH